VIQLRFCDDFVEVFAGQVGDELRILETLKKTSGSGIEVPESAQAFLHATLAKNPEKRLGNGGFAALREHEYFAGFDWAQLEAGTAVPSYIPDVSEAAVDKRATMDDALDSFNPDHTEDLIADADFVEDDPNWRSLFYAAEIKPPGQQKRKKISFTKK
jgi:hypothetical protein